YIAQGMTFSMSNYLNLFVWQLSQAQLMLYPLLLFASVVLMFVVVGPMHARFGKARSAALSAVLAPVIGMVPYALLLAGVWPQPGSNASTAGFYGFLLFANTLGIVSLVSATSMMAEIVEAFEERTGRRAAGSFYSGNWLIQKCATGAGIFITGQIIALAGLATDAAPGSVPQGVIGTLVLCYGGASLVLAAIAAWWLARFPISREAHEARLERLAHSRARPLDEAARADPDAHSIGI
ncbi:MAG: sugar transporter, partial [Sphingomonadales bacterium]